jgi:hypothetical protein
MKSCVEILSEARAIIANKDRWTQRAYARGHHDHPVSISDSAAVRFDASGALMVASQIYSPEGYEAFRKAESFMGEANSEISGGSHSYSSTNDGNIRCGFMPAHEAIMHVYSRAIELARHATA